VLTSHQRDNKVNMNVSVLNKERRTSSLEIKSLEPVQEDEATTTTLQNNSGDEQ
jgi:hypothetical protein